MLSLEVVTDGQEPYELKVGPRAIRKWEKATGKKYVDLMQSETPDLSDVYILAYYAAVIAGRFEGELEEFEDTTDFDFEVDEAPKSSEQAA